MWFLSLFFSLARVWRGIHARTPLQGSAQLGPTCPNPPAWMKNHAGIDPCTVAWHVLNKCASNADLNDFFDTPPLRGNPCACNTVAYSLIFACGICLPQQQYQTSWSNYADTLHCNSPGIQTYPSEPPQVPEGAIPAWAYVPVNDDEFDIDYAEYIGSLSTLHDQTTAGPYTGLPAESPPRIAQATTSPAYSSGRGSATTTESSPTVAPPPTPPVPPAPAPSSTSSSANEPGPAPSRPVSQSAAASPKAAAPTGSGPRPFPPTPSGTGRVGQPLPVSDNDSSAPPGELSRQSSTATAVSGNPPLPGQNLQGPPKRRTRVGAIVGGVVGGIVAAVVLAALAMFLKRRRRLRREKEAVLARTMYGWWQRHPEQRPAPGGVPLECSTIAGDEDGDDQVTLPGDDAIFAEGKSVKYGNYPDL